MKITVVPIIVDAFRIGSKDLEKVGGLKIILNLDYSEHSIYKDQQEYSWVLYTWQDLLSFMLQRMTAC